MPIINVLKRKNINTELVTKFTEWFCDTYGVNGDNVSIVIDVNRRVSNNGNCSCPVNSDSIIVIEIELNRSIATVSEDYLLYILGHELWHARQYVKGLLKDTDDQKISIWRGKKIDESVLSYDELPWEKDAFRNEKKVNNAWRGMI